MSRKTTVYDRFYKSKNRGDDNGRPVVEMLYHFWINNKYGDGYVNIASRINIGSKKKI